MGIKRDGSTKTMNTGLWFGPRLGRVQKRNLYAFTPDLEDYYNAAGTYRTLVNIFLQSISVRARNIYRSLNLFYVSSCVDDDTNFD